MKKVSVITMHRIYNYGSVLQTYATQKVLEAAGLQCEILDYISPFRDKKPLFLEYPPHLKGKKLKKAIYYIAKVPSFVLKDITFGGFIKKYLKLSAKKYITNEDILKAPPHADLYITGSDQVWNSKYNHGVDPSYYLNYASPDAKRIAYVASFGRSELSDEEAAAVEPMLKQYADKVQYMTTCMMENPSILLLSSEYEPLYEEGGQKVDEFETASDGLEQVPFTCRFAHSNRPGCVMAVRKTLIERVSGIWEAYYPHDAFLWAVAMLFDGNYLLHKPLIRYRRHDSNASAKMVLECSEHMLAMKRMMNIIRWAKTNETEAYESHKAILEGCLRFAELRYELLEKKKLINWVKLFGYRRFYRSARQQAGDLYLILQK